MFCSAFVPTYYKTYTEHYINITQFPDDTVSTTTCNLPDPNPPPNPRLPLQGNICMTAPLSSKNDQKRKAIENYKA